MYLRVVDLYTKLVCEFLIVCSMTVFSDYMIVFNFRYICFRTENKKLLFFISARLVLSCITKLINFTYIQTRCDYVKKYTPTYYI